ncbi:MAG: phosphopantetheine-binding protein [Rhodanobacteraceae bacterium]
MDKQTPAEQELAKLIVDSLNLEDVAPEAIDPEAPLFGGDLGLDSIDALELALAVSKHYGVQLRSDNPDNRRVFGSLRELAQYIEAGRAAA